MSFAKYKDNKAIMSHKSEEKTQVTFNPVASIDNLKVSFDAITPRCSDQSLQERINGAKEAVLELSDLVGKIETTKNRDELVDLFVNCFQIRAEMEVYLAMGVWEKSWFSEDPDVYDLFGYVNRECNGLEEKIMEMDPDYEPNDFLAYRLNVLLEAYGTPNEFEINLDWFYEECVKKTEKFLYPWIERGFGIKTKKARIFIILLPILSTLALIPATMHSLLTGFGSILVAGVFFAFCGSQIDGFLNAKKVGKMKQAIVDLRGNRNRDLALAIIENLDLLKKGVEALKYPSSDTDESRRWTVCMENVELCSGLKTCIDNPDEGSVMESDLVGFCRMGVNKFLWKRGLNNEDTAIYHAIDSLRNLISCAERGVVSDGANANVVRETVG